MTRSRFIITQIKLYLEKDGLKLSDVCNQITIKYSNFHNGIMSNNPPKRIKDIIEKNIGFNPWERWKDLDYFPSDGDWGLLANQS